MIVYFHRQADHEIAKLSKLAGQLNPKLQEVSSNSNNGLVNGSTDSTGENGGVDLDQLFNFLSGEIPLYLDQYAQIFHLFVLLLEKAQMKKKLQYWMRLIDKCRTFRTKLIYIALGVVQLYKTDNEHHKTMAVMVLMTK